MTCGDGTCSSTSGENCFSCPADCGRCPSCGDGLCRGTENCASCQADCGVCSVCPNMRCESEGGFEDCINCPADCGMCPLRACGESLTCTFGCFSFGGGGGIPSFSLSCLANCVAQTCADSRSFLDAVVSCAVMNFPMCGGPGGGGGIACIMSACSSEIRACLADRGC